MKIPSTAEGSEQRFAISYISQWLPWLILIICLNGTYHLWAYAQQEALADIRTTFNFRALDTISRISQQLKSYEQVLQGIKGLYVSSDSVQRDEFHNYINSLNLQEHDPGIQGVHFVKVVPQEQKSRYISSIRKEGFPDFTIFPEGKRASYCPVTYVEPFSSVNQKVFGLDTCAEERRSATKNRARDTGKTALSGKTTLSIEVSSNPQTGVVMALPLYTRGMPHDSVAERRASIYGWITATFRMGALMDAILRDGHRDIDVEIYDGENEMSERTLLYDADNLPHFSSVAEFQFITSKRIQIADRVWTIAIYPLPAFVEQMDIEKPRLIAYSGVGFSILLSFLTWLLVQGRSRALKVAAKMNKELIASEERLNEAQHISHIGNWELEIVTGELTWSDEVFQLFEIDRNQFAATYEGFLNAVHPDDRDAVNSAYTVSLKTQEPYEITHRLLMGDGRTKWVVERCTSYFDAEGKPIRSVGTIQDITERIKAEEATRIAATTFETHEAIMITDAAANIIRVNRAFEKTTGYSAEEVVGKNPRILSSGRHDKEFYANMWQEILDVGTWSGEIWDRNKSGNIYPKQATITAVKNSSGITTQYVSIFTDISDRKKAEEEIHNLAFYDALTRLPNRRLLLDRLGIALSVSVRNKFYGALLFLDLDNFKMLNDTLGHEAGDTLLVEVASRLKFCVREVDTVARLGGDEFVVLIENISANEEDASQNIAHVAEKIRAVLATPYQMKGNTHHSSPSIGVCLFCGNDQSVEELIKRADMAMYQAKDSGRNRVRFFDPRMQQSVEAHAALESDLRRALAEQQLQLHYQIQLDQDRKPIGAEALIRWTHPERGMVPPSDFIPVAEESSLILDIGHWVLDTACRQIAAWSQHPLTRNLTLAVNISAQQFKQPDFVEQVAAVVQKHHINPSRLKLELTEGVALDDIESVSAKMLSLRNELGVTLSLDDFGTGFSSLSYLKRLPLDQIKVDQSFVRDISTDASDAVMVKTIIDMAQNFSLDVIAEGVETESQLKFLKDNDCNAYQGYLFSKPLPIEQFEALLKLV